MQLENELSNMFQSYNDIVTVPELAKMLRVGRNTAYDLVNNGQVKAVKVGNQIRIPKSSIIQFINIFNNE